MEKTERETEALYDQMCQIAQRLCDRNYYRVCRKDTREILYYKDAPELLIGRIPVYKQIYVVREESFRERNIWRMAMDQKFGAAFFFSREEAEEYAKQLNEEGEKI